MSNSNSMLPTSRRTLTGLVAVSALIGASLLATAAAAGHTTLRRVQITQVQLDADSTPFLRLVVEDAGVDGETARIGCDTITYNRYGSTPVSWEGLHAVQSMALAAMLAGRQVDIYTNGIENGECVATSLTARPTPTIE